MELKSLVQKAKAVRKINDVVYDKDWNVGFKLQFLPKADLQRMIGKHTEIDFDSRSHTREEKINNKNLTREILDTCVVGWFGVTPKWLATQVPLDLSDVEDPNAEVPFSQENLLTIIDESYNLEGWIFENVKDAGKFSKKIEAEVKN